jgi:hypothetical protein
MSDLPYAGNTWNTWIILLGPYDLSSALPPKLARLPHYDFVL